MEPGVRPGVVGKPAQGTPNRAFGFAQRGTDHRTPYPHQEHFTIEGVWGASPFPGVGPVVAAALKDCAAAARSSAPEYRTRTQHGSRRLWIVLQ